jgi:hypothetical protein
MARTRASMAAKGAAKGIGGLFKKSLNLKAN